MTEKQYTLSGGGMLTREEEYIDNGSENNEALVPFCSSQTLTIAAAGAPTTAVTDTAFFPAASLIMGAVFEVVQAPGGGATEIDFGRTSGGNLDELLDGAAVTLAAKHNTLADRTADTTGLPINNAAADTGTLTVDQAVTGASLIVRCTVFGFRLAEAS